MLKASQQRTRKRSYSLECAPPMASTISLHSFIGGLRGPRARRDFIRQRAHAGLLSASTISMARLASHGRTWEHAASMRRLNVSSSCTCRGKVDQTCCVKGCHMKRLSRTSPPGQPLEDQEGRQAGREHKLRGREHGSDEEARGRGRARGGPGTVRNKAKKGERENEMQLTGNKAVKMSQAKK
eukprot:1735723-Pleurochrysis_carterae.AAC.3